MGSVCLCEDCDGECCLCEDCRDKKIGNCAGGSCGINIEEEKGGENENTKIHQEKQSA